MAIESYRHVEHAYFVHVDKFKKNEGSRAKNVDFVAVLRSSLISCFNRFLDVIWLWEAIDT